MRRLFLCLVALLGWSGWVPAHAEPAPAPSAAAPATCTMPTRWHERGGGSGRRSGAARPARRPPWSPRQSRRTAWTVTREGNRSALRRRHPLTVEGHEIGSFEVGFSCGQAPNAYQATYGETRLASGAAATAAAATGANGAPKRLSGVRMAL